MKFQKFISWIAFFRPKCLPRSTKWRKPKKFQLKWPFEGNWVGKFLPFGGEPWWVWSWDWDWARRHLWVERVGRLGWLCRWLVVVVVLLLLFWLRHADMKDLIREEKDRESLIILDCYASKRPDPVPVWPLSLSLLSSRRIFFFSFAFYPFAFTIYFI